MTSKRDLKRRVRERQERTGERYTTALRHVKGGGTKPPTAAIPVVEMVDLGSQAAKLGLKCRVLMTPDLPKTCGIAAVEKLRDALHATQDDPATSHFRAVALAGERRIAERGWANELLAEGRRFMARARAGIGGVSEGGSMIALHVRSRGGVETVVCILWMMNVAGGPEDRDPMIVVTTPDGIARVLQFDGALTLAVR